MGKKDKSVVAESPAKEKVFLISLNATNITCI